MDKRLIVFVASTLFFPLQATTMLNYAEMVCALAAIPCEIAANQLDDNPEKVKAAAALHLAADTINVATKALFFCNRLDADGAESLAGKDCLVNGALALRDLGTWYRHLKGYLYPDNAADQKELPALEPKAKKVTRIMRAWQVAGLPCLKGLTAFAVACTQAGATEGASKQARVIASVAHGLMRLIDEYCALKSSSPYRRLLLVGILCCVAWLCYECSQYDGRPDKPVPVDRRVTSLDLPCSICFTEDDPGNCTRLTCGHVYCDGCLKQHLATRIKEGRAGHVECPHDGCRQELSSDDIKYFTADDHKAFDAYCDAATQAYVATAKGFRYCPFQDCAQRDCAKRDCAKGGYANGFFYEDKCPLVIECSQCNKRYCARCLVDHSQAVDCQKKDVEAAEERLDRDFIAKNKDTVVCPDCRQGIFRKSGCNHMTCRCGCQFCFVCKKKYVGRGWHLEHPGKPCPLFDDNTHQDERS